MKQFNAWCWCLACLVSALLVLVTSNWQLLGVVAILPPHIKLARVRACDTLSLSSYMYVRGLFFMVVSISIMTVVSSSSIKVDLPPTFIKQCFTLWTSLSQKNPPRSLLCNEGSCDLLIWQVLMYFLWLYYFCDLLSTMLECIYIVR